MVDRLPARSLFAAAVIALPAVAPAQTVVSGVVHDSLTRSAFVDARVELVPAGTPWMAGFTVRSDSTGRFRIDAVPAGDYYLGFHHPRLDSLGLDPVTRRVRVSAFDRRMVADLALPGSRSVAEAICGPMNDESGLIVGRVFDAVSGSRITSGTVSARWGELQLGEGGVNTRPSDRRVRITRDGRYLLCGVPAGTPLQLRAIADSGAASSAISGEIEVRFAYDTPLLQQTLLVAPRDSPSSGAAAVRTAGMKGRIVSLEGLPVRGARVTVDGSTDIGITDSAGVFRLRNLPIGSRAVDVTAIGYLKVRSAAELRADGEFDLTVRLSRLSPELEAVTVEGRSSDPTGFHARRERGLGYFVDADQIRKWGPPSLANALSMAPMLRRGQLTGRGNCTPVFFVDGVRIDYLLGEVLNETDLGGIEVYANPADVPPQFGTPGNRFGALTSSGGCSVIVIWTKSFLR
ncbi:MAG: carboxypeptidase-like regulatory domain-containing protein [Gemmatimonadaceae bacterium]|nr:carboxypeptidase-like regulatory domain-containing protein [Gemmatimonadaceae bacterium]